MSSRDTLHTLVARAWRIVAEVADPPPSKVEARALRDHFRDACGFCGTRVRQRSTDCLVLADPTGPHAVGNRILSCEPCRRSREPDEDWRALLTRRCGDEALRARRTARITAWQQAHPSPPSVAGPEVDAIHAWVEAALQAIGMACNDLRAVRDRLQRGGNWRSAQATASPPLAGRPIQPAAEAGVSPLRPGSGIAGLRALRSRPRLSANASLTMAVGAAKTEGAK